MQGFLVSLEGSGKGIRCKVSDISSNVLRGFSDKLLRYMSQGKFLCMFAQDFMAKRLTIDGVILATAIVLTVFSRKNSLML